MKPESNTPVNNVVCDRDEIEQALNELLNSAEFANADRLKNFLDYVVLETLEGRGEDIKGKTIAQDVYGRNAAADGDPENVVRVDARRLRRRLADYYADEGETAPVRIHIDSGGYVPRFELREREGQPGAPATLGIGYLSRTAAVIFVCFIAAVLALFYWRTEISTLFQSAEPQVASTDRLKRQTILEKSPTALQAVNMAEQARGLIVPIFDPNRQKLAFGFFKQAIDLDPTYLGGYAGAAQTLANLAHLSPPGPDEQQLLHDAQVMADKAIELAPTDPWAQSAASWAAFANRDYEKAARLSARAHTLAPENRNILDYHGAMLVFSGEFELARRLTDPKTHSHDPAQRYAGRNIFAAANFFLGRYEESLTEFITSTERGDPFSPVVVAFQVAASHSLGDMKSARKYAGILQKTWPKLPLDQIFSRVFRHPEHANEVIWRLKDAGWSPPGPVIDEGVTGGQ